MLPPHLPNPTCNIRNHERWINLKLILVAVGLGLLSGVTGAMIVIGWIWPNFGGGDTWIVSQNRSSAIPPLTESVIIETSERIFGVYADSVKISDTTVLKNEENMGDAVAVSSDGWLAMYLKKGASISLYKKWRVLGSSGAIYKVDNVIRDQYSSFSYIKISPLVSATNTDQNPLNQFKVASFSDPADYSDEVYVYEGGNWKYNRVGYRAKNFSSLSHLDSAPNYSYELENGSAAGSIVITGRGRMVGFVSDEGTLLPNAQITRILPEILSKQKITYPSFGAAGWFGFEQPIIMNAKFSEGFYVDRVWSKKSKLRRGDIVTHINGQIVQDENLWYNTGSSQVSLTVMRAGKSVDLSADLIYAAAGDL